MAIARVTSLLSCTATRKFCPHFLTYLNDECQVSSSSNGHQSDCRLILFLYPFCQDEDVAAVEEDAKAETPASVPDEDEDAKVSDP